MEFDWGLLAPETLNKSRRSSLLGEGATIRMFNQLAVPGVGGVYFGKQVVLALLGIRVAELVRAERRKVSNIEVANSIEALACWLAFESNGWNRDARLRGVQKMRNRTLDDLKFDATRRGSFYVSQPMRMATVEILPILGFANAPGTRFNSYQCDDDGETFLREALGSDEKRGFNVAEYLKKWVIGKDAVPKRDVEKLRAVLSPLEPTRPKAAAFLKDRLLYNGADDRRNRLRRLSVWKWIKNIATARDFFRGWSERPEVIEPEHWRDLEAGTKFFATRDAAVAVLRALESELARKRAAKLELTAENLKNIDFSTLKNAALRYLELAYPYGGSFAEECARDNPADVVRSLAARDGAGLILLGSTVARGRAFRGDEPDSKDEEGEEAALNDAGLPPGVSRRVVRARTLYQDLTGEKIETAIAN